MQQQIQSAFAGGARFCDCGSDVEPAFTVNPAFKRVAYRERVDQAEAVAVFLAEGPVTLDTLQNSEIGRRAPRGLAAVTLENFLNRQTKKGDT